MNILEGIVYGLISGFSEFLPISSLGHQELLKMFFGVASPEPLRDIFVHLAFLIAVFVGCGTYIEKVRRELQQNSKTKKRRSRQHEHSVVYDVTLLKNATYAMILGMIVLRIVFRSSSTLMVIGFGFLLNGIFMFIPEYMPHGNKDAKKMSAFDSFLLGLVGSLSVLPGFSRVGSAISCAVARGADQTKAYNWLLVLTIPAVFLLLIFDIVVIFQTGFGTVTLLSLLSYLLSGLFAFISSIAGIYLMRFMLVRSVFSTFAFYSWGASLLSFLLYLTA